jgi:hypothetical protein
MTGIGRGWPDSIDNHAQYLVLYSLLPSLWVAVFCFSRTQWHRKAPSIIAQLYNPAMADTNKRDVNPYESPREPLTASQMARRAVSVAIVLLLTPPAMIVAVFCCCSAGRWIHPEITGWIMLCGPFAVLGGLMATAAVLDRPRADDPSSVQSRTVLYFATPFVVAIAAIVGLGLAALVTIAIASISGGISEASIWTGAVFFFMPPSVALVFMLYRTWMAR